MLLATFSHLLKGIRKTDGVGRWSLGRLVAAGHKMPLAFECDWKLEATVGAAQDAGESNATGEKRAPTHIRQRHQKAHYHRQPRDDNEQQEFPKRGSREQLHSIPQDNKSVSDTCALMAKHCVAFCHLDSSFSKLVS